MGYFWVIIIGSIILYLVEAKPEDSLKYRTRTKEGFPKIDVINVRCEDILFGIEVLISCDSDNFFINSYSIDKIIPIDNIIDIQIQTIEDVESFPEFSGGKALIGTILFGSMGAIAGFAGKKKRKIKRLVISYKNEDKEIKEAIFSQKTKDGKSIGAEGIILNSVKNDFLNVINGKYPLQQAK